jgi:hypothetical protein
MIFLLLLSTVGILADLIAIGEWTAHYKQRRRWVLFSLLVSLLAFCAAMIVTHQRDVAEKRGRDELIKVASDARDQATAAKEKLDQTGLKLKSTAEELHLTRMELDELNNGIKDLAGWATNGDQTLSLRAVLDYLAARPEKRDEILTNLFTVDQKGQKSKEASASNKEASPTDEGSTPKQQPLLLFAAQPPPAPLRTNPPQVNASNGVPSDPKPQPPSDMHVTGYR